MIDRHRSFFLLGATLGLTAAALVAYHLHALRRARAIEFAAGHIAGVRETLNANNRREAFD